MNPELQTLWFPPLSSRVTRHFDDIGTVAKYWVKLGSNKKAVLNPKRGLLITQRSVVQIHPPQPILTLTKTVVWI
jgi:hypothetical protein